MNYKKQLKSTLQPKRYNHTIGVEKTAIMLAKIHQYDKEKASIAAFFMIAQNI
jgi:HD superfamily phosphohydrolase YqeK